MSENNSATIRKRRIIHFLLFLLLSGGIIYFLIPFVSVSKECGRCSTCINHIRTILLALYYYTSINESLPPAWTTDEKGNRLHSWRVLILPYMGMDEKEIYDKIRLNEPWDSEYNSQFHRISTVYFYACRSAKKIDGQCNYSVIVDKNGFFPGAESYIPKPEDEKSIILIENPHSFCWMDPYADFTYEKMILESSLAPDPQYGHPGRVPQSGCNIPFHKNRYLHAITYGVSFKFYRPGKVIDLYDECLVNKKETSPDPLIKK